MKDMNHRIFKMINNELESYYNMFEFQRNNGTVSTCI